jgi:hypothetical protein
MGGAQPRWEAVIRSSRLNDAAVLCPDYAPYYAPAPVYVPGPRCWLEHERVWDGYGYVIQRVRVCE